MPQSPKSPTPATVETWRFWDIGTYPSDPNRVPRRPSYLLSVTVGRV